MWKCLLRYMWCMFLFLMILFGVLVVSIELLLMMYVWL